MKDKIKSIAEYKLEMNTEQLCILIGYRKSIANRYLNAKTDADKEDALKFLNEANTELKKLLLID